MDFLDDKEKEIWFECMCCGSDNDIGFDLCEDRDWIVITHSIRHKKYSFKNRLEDAWTILTGKYTNFDIVLNYTQVHILVNRLKKYLDNVKI